MLDVNKTLEAALRAGGITLPACEDPYRGDAPEGAYITWNQGAMATRHASGKPFVRLYPVQVNLWILQDSLDWILLRDQVADALERYRTPENLRLMVTEVNGAKGWDAVGGRVITLAATVLEMLW